MLQAAGKEAQKRSNGQTDGTLIEWLLYGLPSFGAPFLSFGGPSAATRAQAGKQAPKLEADHVGGTLTERLCYSFPSFGVRFPSFGARSVGACAEAGKMKRRS